MFIYTLCRMAGSCGPSDRSVGEMPYEDLPRGARAYWSPCDHYVHCECRHSYTYPNEIVLAVVKERKVLARDNTRLGFEVKYLKKTIEMQAERTKELEYDVVKGRERVDDLSAQLGEAQERMVKRARKVRVRAESILNICGDLLGEESDEASHVGSEVGDEPAQSGGSISPTVD